MYESCDFCANDAERTKWLDSREDGPVEAAICFDCLDDLEATLEGTGLRPL